MNLTRTSILAAGALALGTLCWAAAVPRPALAAPGEAPRLVLLVAVDQMRYDYLPRFASGFTGGLRRLMRDGAVFTNAHLDHYPSVTAVGPLGDAHRGPPLDQRHRRQRLVRPRPQEDRDQRRGPRARSSSGARRRRILAAPPPGQHRRRRAEDGAPRLARDRGLAQGPQRDPDGRPDGRPRPVVGHETGAFVSSTWYAPQLPKWAADFNAGKPADAWLGSEWRAAGEGGALLGTDARSPGAGVLRQPLRQRVRERAPRLGWRRPRSRGSSSAAATRPTSWR